MEIEAKFAVQDKRTYQNVLRMDRVAYFTMGETTASDIYDTYLDTADRRILRGGYAFRQRECPIGVILTLKSTGAADDNIHRREEIETTLPEAIPIHQWPDSPIKQRVLEIARDAPLNPLFSLTQHRITRPVWCDQRLVAELSLDVVTYHHGHESPHREVEVELRADGTEDDLAAISAYLMTMPGLTSEKRSKFERGMALAAAHAPRPESPGITPDDTITEAIRKTLRFQFLRMIANEEGTYLGEDIEALHDMRVAIRRMRTAFRVFEHVLETDMMAPHLKELRYAGRILGVVRDMDVFRKNGQTYLDSFPKDKKPDLAPVFSAWNAEYTHVRAIMRQYLDSRRYALFKDRFSAHLEHPSSPPEDTPRVCKAAPGIIMTCLADFYAHRAQIDKANANPADFHQLRIAAKYLRYTLEYFREVLGTDAGKAIERLKSLQDHLGALQDAVVAGERLRSVITWGTWSAPAEAQWLWHGSASGTLSSVADYLDFQESTIRHLIDSFPQAWAYYENDTFTQLINNAAAALTSKNQIHDKESPMTTNPKFVILLGPPAAGKGTQATRLSAHLGLPHVASGDLFRYNLKNETELGLKAKTYMDKGELVPDDITIAMVLDRLNRPDCATGALLDGFPRTLAQAEALDKALNEQGSAINGVLNIIVPNEVLVERVTGRRLCRTCGEPYHIKFNPPKKEGVCDIDGGELYQRADDTEATVQNRLKVYWEQTSPLIGYYQEKGILVDIDGNQGIDAVTEALQAAVTEL